MSEYNLGTAKGIIEIDYKGSGADRAREDLKQTSKSASSADESLRKTGQGAGIAGAAIVAGLGLALKSASDFEKGLSGIQAVSGATTSEMDVVRKKALQLGADTAFSAGESAAAMEELVKAGLTIPDVMNGAADATVSLAAAGGVALPEAAAIAANAMNQFGLAAEDMPNIADKIAGAANASAIDVSDFGQSMSQAGAVANLAGLSFDDTALAITAMGNAGIKGSDAGTSLKTFLQNLQPVTDKQIGLMKELGLVTKNGANQFFDAAGKIKPMTEIAGVLGKSLKGMSDAQKTATLETLFGSDAIRAAAVIADQGAAGMDKLSGSINKVKAADVAKVRMGNLAGQVEQLKGSAETLAIQLGTVLIPIFTNIVKSLTGAVNWFTNLDSSTQRIIVTVAAVTAGLLLFVAATIKIVSFVKTVIATVKALQAAWVALNITFSISPIGIIIVLIIALVVALVILYKKNETVRNFINKAWAAIKNAIAATVEWITGTAVPWLVNAWNAIVDGAKWLWNWIKTIFMAIVMAVTLPLRLVIAGIQAALGFIIGIWRAVWGLFGPLVKAVWDLILAIIQVAFAWIVVFIKTYLNVIIGFWKAVWNGIVAVVKFVWNLIKTVIKTQLNAIRSVIQAIWSRIGGTVMGALNMIKGIVSSVFNAIKAVATVVWGALVSIISSKINAAKAKVQAVLSAIKGLFSGVGSWLTDAGRKLIQGLIDGITGMVGKVTGAVSGIADKIRSFLPGSPIKEGPLRDHGWNSGAPGKKLVSSLAGGIESEMGTLDRLLSGLSTDVSVGLGSNGVAVAGSAARTAGSAAPAAAGTNNALRAVSGGFTIDASGRAYFQGLAQEVVDSDQGYAATRSRMGG